jgi:hypothetical protein
MPLQNVSPGLDKSKRDRTINMCDLLRVERLTMKQLCKLIIILVSVTVQHRYIFSTKGEISFINAMAFTKLRLVCSLLCKIKALYS